MERCLYYNIFWVHAKQEDGTGKRKIGRGELHLEIKGSDKTCKLKGKKSLPTKTSFHVYDDLSTRNASTSILAHFGDCIF